MCVKSHLRTILSRCVSSIKINNSIIFFNICVSQNESGVGHIFEKMRYGYIRKPYG